MNIIRNPKRAQWPELIERPAFEKRALEKGVKSILEDVKRNGDGAIRRYTRLLDQVEINELQVSEKEIENATAKVSSELKSAIKLAKQNIETFHTSQLESMKVVETMEGVSCWRKSVAIERVGLYIPGGSAPLFSTILMLGIPAKLAGCKEVTLCTPPDKNGNINPAILYTAQLVGITSILKIGGAQAVAAMAYGTETISPVDKIFGPGNQYVTKAKQLVQQSGVAIDMPAGPSEVLVVADKSAVPEFVASDLLSQAEHGRDSQVLFLADNEAMIRKTLEAMRSQLEELPRKEIALEALKNSKAILLGTLKDCIELSNVYAPEHLIIASEQPELWMDQVENAGSVFLGNYSCESAGDYASGTNHTLPTNGFARNYSGVSVDSFVKKITFQQLTEKGIRNIGPAIEKMAEAEELFAHKNAVTLRLKALNDD